MFTKQEALSLMRSLAKTRGQDAMPLVTLPDPRLAQASFSVDPQEIDDTLRTFLQGMITTMRKENGIGLAAVQVGVLLRIAVIDLGEDLKREEELEGKTQENAALLREHPFPWCVINPEILSVSEEVSICKEGCLSVPGFQYDVERPRSCKVRFVDEQGQEHTHELHGLLSTCFQHELDHIRGILFIDHLSRLKQERVRKRFLKGK